MNIRPINTPLSAGILAAWPMTEPTLARRYGPAKVTPESLAYHCGGAGDVAGGAPLQPPRACVGCGDVRQGVDMGGRGFCPACYARHRRAGTIGNFPLRAK